MGDRVCQTYVLVGGAIGGEHRSWRLDRQLSSRRSGRVPHARGHEVRHKGVLWGMYVRPDARGTGLAASLVQRVIEQARPFLEEILLTVVASNVAACRLYRAAGFEQYGLERRALKIGDNHYDEALMALSLNNQEPS
jgi:ribosomal protein S18 acetylase RimI-like enzyme